MLNKADADPLNFRPPGGESFADVSARMLNFVEDVCIPLWREVRAACRDRVH